MTVIPTAIDTLETNMKRLLKGLEDMEIRGQVETIQTTALLRSPDYWEESRRLEKTSCHSIPSKKPSANASTIVWLNLFLDKV